MRWLNGLLGRKEPSNELLSALGIDPDYGEKDHIHDGITFRRISISELEAKIPLNDARIFAGEISILVCGSGELSEPHVGMIRKIRKHLTTLLDQSIDAVLKETGSDLQDFTRQAREPCIVMGSDGEEFDGKSWSMFF